MEVADELVEELLEALDRQGCVFWACEGPTLDPKPMVTCYRCEALAKLAHVLGRPFGDPDPVADTEHSSFLYRQQVHEFEYRTLGHR